MPYSFATFLKILKQVIIMARKKTTKKKSVSRALRDFSLNAQGRLEKTL